MYHLFWTKLNWKNKLQLVDRQYGSYKQCIVMVRLDYENGVQDKLVYHHVTMTASKTISKTIKWDQNVLFIGYLQGFI